MGRDPNRSPTHPGALLREDMIPATGRPKAEIAQMLRISRQHLNDNLAERTRIGSDIALLLSELFGNTPLFWIRMQSTYDVWHASRKVALSGTPARHLRK